ncbi:probable serine/threonine-protein kinase dyrk2 isoform X2 [Periplaneta americana]|uniref:probable serine/threonine-protein kinase dyrk2 isoform X2 n=1 Tax=Periplaneta americana TaxID=6978 RepID=UPI0037E8A53F
MKWQSLVLSLLLLGFSVGDSLGFEPNLDDDTAKRRSVQGGRSTNIGVQTFAAQQLAASKKLDQARLHAMTARPPAVALVTVPPFKPIPPASASATPTQQTYQQVMTASAIKVAPQNVSRPSRLAQGNSVGVGSVVAVPVPPFQALPSSISRVSNAQTASQQPVVGVQVVRAPVAFRNSLQVATNHFQVRKDPPTAGDEGISSNTLTLRTGATQVKAPSPAVDSSLATMGYSIKTLAKATNLSEEAIAAAIALRQQQLLQQQQAASTSTSTTTTTTTKRPSASPIKKYPLAAPSKVMNAPKEYYPVGYDKNFDDNFVSRVELPDTTFYCGNQKHFPGLYADEDLGCMVFHVCAFTDDGLIMKSFLCPESTLFDQTILKCNWWFYVDCKASKKLYDSNIPISKSYQLMKALAFFSSYNKS